MPQAHDLSIYGWIGLNLWTLWPTYSEKDESVGNSD
jgi:hypothetical protein